MEATSLLSLKGLSTTTTVYVFQHLRMMPFCSQEKKNSHENYTVSANEQRLYSNHQKSRLRQSGGALQLVDAGAFQFASRLFPVRI